MKLFNIIKNFLSFILNWVPRILGKKGEKLFKTNLLVLGILCVCLFAIMRGIRNIEPKLAFMIDSVHLPISNDISLGEGSMICYNGVPTDYIKFSLEEDGTFIWQIDSVQHRDTLMYFKVNDENPQKIEIINDPNQKVHIHIPSGQELSVTGQDIWNEWLSFDKQEDVLLRHFFARYLSLHVSDSDSSRMLWKDVIDNDGIRSFLHRKNKAISLIVLDRYTQVEQTDGHLDGYRYRGRTKMDPNTNRRCKVQFFRVSSNCYDEGEASSDWFQIDTINYVMKASVLLTGWGAGHVMIDASSHDGIELNYPKALGYVGALESLRTNSLGASHMITFKQQGQSFPTSTDIYLPQLSSSIPQDLCSIELNDSITLIRDNNNSITQVSTHRLFGLPFSVLPVFKKVKLNSGNTFLTCRVGIIDFEFAMAYLVFPILVALVLIFLVLFAGSCVRANEKSNTYDNPFYCTSQLSSYPRYMAILILIGLCYAFCKSLIALKLSYTYPYFEKLTGISPISTSLFLLMFYTFAMIINTHLFGSHDYNEEDYYDHSSKRSSWRKWVAWGSTSFVFCGLAYVLFGILDKEVSGGILSSYYDSDIYDYNPLHWREIFGINDNHRSVPYAQLLIEFVLLIIWFFQNLYWQIGKVQIFFDKYLLGLRSLLMKNKLSVIRKKFESVTNSNEKYIIGNSSIQTLVLFAGDNCVYGMILALILAFISFIFPIARIPLWIISSAIAMLCMWEPLKLAFKNLLPWHFLIFIFLAIGGSMLGNFGTAFITLVVIFGLSRSLTSITFSRSNRDEDIDNRHSVFFEMIIISLIYIAFSMIADNGYVTNYVGILTAVICFYYIYDRNTFMWTLDSQNYDRESRWTFAVAVFAVLFAILLPLLCSHFFDPSQVHYNRFSRRVMLYSDFEKQQLSGYRYSESDTEFMTIMSHYMQMEGDNHQCDDPLCNEGHFLHPSISTGQSPVVLNDLSVPAAFIGAYGVGRASIIFFLLLLALYIHISRFSMAYSAEDGDTDSYLTYATQWRLLALFMWIGTSFYIYLSYIGFIPFTGRLVPGFGIDSVGESLESAILLGFMAAVTLRVKDKTDPSPD